MFTESFAQFCFRTWTNCRAALYKSLNCIVLLYYLLMGESRCCCWSTTNAMICQYTVHLMNGTVAVTACELHSDKESTWREEFAKWCTAYYAFRREYNHWLCLKASIQPNQEISRCRIEWLDYSTKGVDPCFQEKQQHGWRYVYVCISYWKLYACIRIILHSSKYHITKASNRKMT